MNLMPVRRIEVGIISGGLHEVILPDRLLRALDRLALGLGHNSSTERISRKAALISAFSGMGGVALEDVGDHFRPVTINKIVWLTCFYAFTIPEIHGD